MKFTKHTVPPVGFQLAPMIDIMFLLLAFFIVTYQMTDNEKDIEVSLPASEEGKAKPRTYLEKIINIHEDGKMVIDGKTYNIDELHQKMKELVRVNKNQPIRLRGDKNTKYGYIVKVISACRKAGVWNFSFAAGTPKPLKKNP